jgi:curved DNA-binding protein CbpA
MPGPTSSPGFDAYKTLQVDPEADPEVIQAAYRRLAQKFHPDVAGAASAERMASINTAWEILRDPERRAAYDRARASDVGGGGGAAGGDPWAGGSGWGPDAPRARGAPSSGRPDAQAGGRGGHGSSPPGGPHPPGGPAAPRGSTAPGDTSGAAGAGASGAAASSAGAGSSGASRSGETTSPDWTSGRSTSGSGYDPSTMRRPDGEGAAGPPPGKPSGSVLTFGRYAGWSLGEIARVDPEYLEWLDRAPIGRAYRDELDPILRRLGRRRTARSPQEESRSGLFRRR